MQGDVDALAEVAPPGAADLVLGHGLLEVVDDPARSPSRRSPPPRRRVARCRCWSPAGYAAVLARTLAGRLAEARALLTDPDGRFGPDDALRRRLDAAALRALLADAGLRWRSCRATGCSSAGCRAPPRDGGPSAARRWPSWRSSPRRSPRCATSRPACTPSPGAGVTDPAARVPAARRGRDEACRTALQFGSPDRPSAAVIVM